MKNHKLHPFEFVGAHKLYTEERFLLADEMGMFKTAQAIFANSKFREKNKKLRTLVVCPTAVREHWAREYQKWAHSSGIANIAYAHNLEEVIKDARRAALTIISYPLMSRLENGTLKKLKDIGFHHVIGDEIHNAKNPDALRTRALKTLSDQADYVSLLSGTPIPNTLADLYVLMSLLDPVEYPFNPEKGESEDHALKVARQSFIQLYVQRPQAVKELLHRKMLRRLAKDYLQEHIPEFEHHLVRISLSGRHLETYQDTLQQDMHVGRKIADLEKASLDPCLVDDSVSRTQRNGKDASDKYQMLEEIVQETMSKKDGKVLVFSDLKTGVIDYLTQKYEKFGAVNITGDVSTESGIRENIRRRFQHDSNTRILLATTTMNEGVDLTAATVEVDLTIADTPAARLQRWKRSHRPGEIKKEKVEAYTLCSEIPGSQASYDSAMLEMLDGKERIVSYLLKGMQVSLEELKVYDKTEKVPGIARAITSPSRAVLGYFVPWRGVGSESALRRIQRRPEISRYIAEIYPTFSMAKNAFDVYLPIIRTMEKERRLETKVDIACGPGMLGHFLQETTIGVDINPDMLREGKKIYPQNTLLQGKMSELPLGDESADFALCSLAFQMNAPKKERAQALREFSRILKPEGYGIISLPVNYTASQEEKRFEEIAKEYGLTLLEKQKEAGKSRLEVYVFQKVHAPQTDELYNMRWNGDPGRKKQ